MRYVALTLGLVLLFLGGLHLGSCGAFLASGLLFMVFTFSGAFLAFLTGTGGGEMSPTGSLISTGPSQYPQLSSEGLSTSRKALFCFISHVRLVLNLACEATLSGEMPMTRAPAPAKSDAKSVNALASAVHPEVSSLG